ncbi:MAG: TlpA family protein disulfide reductase [Myxococcota bacterium]|jgi:cytochrome c biogenesis protein CcmG, thiol:disulfide interchange protein DsbE|nr:TlpA family protein disulfide reductase [Myxococcota bacterium]
MTDQKKPARRADTRFGALSLLVILLIAAGFGVFVLPRVAPTLERKPAPDFALPVVHRGEPGARVRLSEQRGKPILLDFWASWCMPCREQAKVIERVRARHPGLVVLGINVSDDPNKARAYLAESNPSWLVVEDAEGIANRSYEVEALPTLVTIDKSGNIAAIRRRFVPERELGALVNELLE